MTTDDGYQADREALQAMADHGIDMTAECEFELYVNVDDEAQGSRIVQALTEAGLSARSEYEDGESDFEAGWTVFVEMTLVPSLDNMVAAQQRIAAIAEPLGGDVDGWGTGG